MRFDSAAADRFLVAVRAGASNEVAAAHAQLSLDDVRAWLAGRSKATEEFRLEVDKARADLELLAVGQVRRQMSEDPNAAQWIAEKVRTETEFERLRRLTI